MDNSETQEIFNSIKDKLRNWTSSVFNEFYGLQKLGSLYYYTDMNALVNGIIVPEPEVNHEICLWATKWSHLNDSQENYIALDMLKDVFKNNLEVYYAFVSLSGDNHSISFSKEKDSLPMWSMYGAQGTGIMLEFDVSELLKIYGVRLMPCVYYDTEYFESVCKRFFGLEFGDEFEYMSNDKKTLAIAILTIMFVGTLKNSAFKYENEVRIVGIGTPYYDSKRREQFRVKNGVLVPYIKEYLPKSCLKSVWLGPTADKDLSLDALRSYLDSCNIEAEVNCSQIPYRG